MYKFVIMGIQGCGKGTQAKLLADEFGLCHISVGEALRGHIHNQTHLGQAVQQAVSAGHLVPDDIVNQVAKTRLAECDMDQGFILDGFPRNANQAEFLLENFPLDAVINIVVPDRMRHRPHAGAPSVLRLRPGLQPDQSPAPPAGRLRQVRRRVVSREDDTAAAIAARVAEFHAKTEPVLVLFRKHNLLVNVDGTGSIKAVAAEIRKKLELPVR